MAEVVAVVALDVFPTCTVGKNICMWEMSGKTGTVVLLRKTSLGWFLGQRGPPLVDLRSELSEEEFSFDVIGILLITLFLLRVEVVVRCDLGEESMWCW